MGIQSGDGFTHTWCDKCKTIQKVRQVKHYIDSDNITVCLIGCRYCRDSKIDYILNQNREYYIPE